ncbi:transcription factor GTE8-like [Papaver somniferum]|uniref:transcription factor GTE8-like n=1 Tax=Papaver somniferum TaxID=3469 RepID=UPI000E703D3C|nr:transcription factor GTE8-like [Papaver somniferum]
MGTVLLDYTGQKDTKKYSQKVLPRTMDKSEKMSRRYSSSDLYRESRHQPIETMCESEGLGSSGGFDTEMTASEVSCAPPRKKSISLSNAGNSDAFGVPIRVLSLSRMPRMERKELKLRLQMELEQVRNLRKKIDVKPVNSLALSSSRNIRNSDEGQKRLFVENTQKSVGLVAGQGKKRGPPAHIDDTIKKRGDAGRFESAKPVAPPSSTSHAILMKQCDTLLKRVMTHQFSWVFKEPVDVVKLNIPDYFTVIKQPMDLGTVQRKIDTGAYLSPLDFVADVRLTFSNAKTYNPRGTDVHTMADTLSKYFEVRWKPIEKKLSTTGSGPVCAKSNVPEKEEEYKPMPFAKKRKTSSINHEVKTIPEVKTLPAKQTVSVEEKHNLSRDLGSLQEIPNHIIDFLKKHSFRENENSEEELEIDMDVFGYETLVALRKLVDDHLREKQRKPEKAEPCEMEGLNDSGLSNMLSTQPCKVNEPVEEEIDIGGNDPPVSSYPPIEIKKDSAHRNSKCSSSSSSSSDSGSSSSDSDSASSSGSESDGVKASSPVTKASEKVVSGEALHQKQTDLNDPHDGSPSISGLDQLEQNSHRNPALAEANSSQDGESALSERQVSPDKLYRAALLRSRFADTILKAREKTLGQGEKIDPEKFRREKEELERLKKEEKARLLAEAKAAEDARRQAEIEAAAEAAAEAKRKRELEREAARQALQKMEKTVEINENCRFLEDLEMLRSAPSADLLPSSVDEKSPDHSEDIFNFQGMSNPLERLGLYMKMDDDEEEECQPDSGPCPVKDVEEGEID